MIKFFRKIRYDLMGKNKTGKYLKYAIGEIILVVIGILIALQINNWNEGRKTQRAELKYMEQLREDLLADSVFFDSRMQGIKTQSEVLGNLKKLCAGTLDEAERFKILVATQNPFTRFAMQSRVVNEELDLSTISDDHIRDLLRKYRSKYEYVLSTGNQHNTMARENYMTMAKLNPVMLEVDINSNTLADYTSFCEYPHIDGIIGLQVRTISLFSINIESFMELNFNLSEAIEKYTEQKQ
jgi:hypothetical protein